MAGESHIAPLARQRRIRQMTDGLLQSRIRIALDDHSIKLQPGYHKLAEHIALSEEAWRCWSSAVARTLQNNALALLVVARFQICHACVSQTKQARKEQKINSSVNTDRAIELHWLHGL
jgi:hypothetical protein